MNRLSSLTFLALVLLLSNFYPAPAEARTRNLERSKNQRPTQSVVHEVIQKIDAERLLRMETASANKLLLDVNGFRIDQHWKLIDENDREFGFYGIDPRNKKLNR